MQANLANVLRDPIEGEAGLVRHNVEVLTDSLTGDQQNDNDVDDNEDQTFIWKCNDGNISQNWRYDKPGLLDTVFQLTIRTRKDGGGKNRFSVVGCKIIDMIISTHFEQFVRFIQSLTCLWHI